MKIPTTIFFFSEPKINNNIISKQIYRVNFLSARLKRKKMETSSAYLSFCSYFLSCVQSKGGDPAFVCSAIKLAECDYKKNRFFLDHHYLYKSSQVFSWIALSSVRLRRVFFCWLCSVSVHRDPSCMCSILWPCAEKCCCQRSGTGLINWEMSDQIYLQSTNRKRGRVMEIVRA